MAERLVANGSRAEDIQARSAGPAADITPEFYLPMEQAPPEADPGRETGLASRILEASFRTETPKMFAALLLLVATGVLIFWGFNGLSRLLLGRWHASEQTLHD